jgi:hypothetical protein
MPNPNSQAPSSSSAVAPHREVQNTPIAGKVAGAEHLKAGWAQFVAQIPNKAIQIFLSQTDGVIPQFFNGEILLHIAQKFAADSIAAQKNELTKQLTQFFGAEVVLRLSGGTVAAPRNDTGFEEVTQPQSTAGEPQTINEQTIETVALQSNSAKKERLPVEQAIVDLFAAREIPVLGR